MFFIEFLMEKRESIFNLLPHAFNISDWKETQVDEEGLEKSERSLSFVLSHLAFSSPEYGETETPAQRFLPYMITDTWRETDTALSVEKFLVQSLKRDAGAANATELALDFSEGVPLSDLEDRFEGLTSGMIHGFLRDHVTHLKGLADIIDVISGGQLPSDHQYVARMITSDSDRVSLRRVVRHIRVRIMQMVLGAPEDVLWMRELRGENGSKLISRAVVMSLRAHGLKTLENILDGGQQDKFHQAMNKLGAGKLQRDQIRTAAETHRINRTEARRDRIRKQLPQCDNLIGNFFASRGRDFEDSLNECFECVGFKVKARDDEGGSSRFPDFVMEIENADGDVVVECKSKDGYGEVKLGEATDVGGKALTHGLNRFPMVTVCQPYISTDVPRNLKTTKDLSVVNGEDLAFALVALKLKKITSQRFKSWITTPGQPTLDELFV